MEYTFTELLELRKMYIEIAAHYLTFKGDNWESKFDKACEKRDKIVLLIDKLINEI